jgi:hypothetical protein
MQLLLSKIFSELAKPLTTCKLRLFAVTCLKSIHLFYIKDILPTIPSSYHLSWFIEFRSTPIHLAQSFKLERGK